MPPKEPTRHQLSSRLAYNSQTPSFLVKLQNQVAGRSTGDDEDEPQYLDGIDEFGRERRPPIPERPENDVRGPEDEDDVDEKPVVVVLKEGKHLTELEAKNEKRKAQGLSPLPPENDTSERSILPKEGNTESSIKPTNSSSGLSFSSKNHTESRTSSLKRKVPDARGKSEDVQPNPKKTKKSKKGLLSFDRADMG